MSDKIELVQTCRACDGVGRNNMDSCDICEGTGQVPYLEPRSIFRMTPEERKAIMDANPPEITGIHTANVYLDWSWMGCGFGQLHFTYHRETEKITCMDEHMGRERVRTILIALANHIADNAVLDGDEDA